MKKEVVLAIGAGALLGLVVAFGLWRANSAMTPQKNNQPPTETPSPTTAELTIANPADQAVITTPTITLSGITSNSLAILVSGEEKNYVASPAANGTFSQAVDLAGGINEVKVFSFDTGGNSKEKDTLLVYSSEFAKYFAPVASPSAETQSASDSIRAKVDEKIAEAKSSPTAYIGTITDITDINIEIKNLTGGIDQAAINANTTDFIKSTADETKTITRKDVAIGDFIVAMGTRDGNKILDAKRILVTDAFKSSSRTAILGTIDSIDKKIVTVKTKDKSWTLNFPTSWNGPEISELKESDKVLVAGTAKDTNLTVSLIKKI